MWKNSSKWYLRSRKVCNLNCSKTVTDRGTEIVHSFNLIIYLRANQTAQRLITKPACIEKEIHYSNNNLIQFSCICMLIQQPKSRLQSEHEGEKQANTHKVANKALYNI
jgi:hypothetical protein